jgi:hypothetical protein
MRSVYELTFIGLDVHKDTISVAVLDQGSRPQRSTRSVRTVRRSVG